MHEEDVKHLLVIMGTITVISFVIVVTMLALAVVFICYIRHILNKRCECSCGRVGSHQNRVITMSSEKREGNMEIATDQINNYKRITDFSSDTEGNIITTLNGSHNSKLPYNINNNVNKQQR